MAGGRSPINQLNAIPLIGAAQYVSQFQTAVPGIALPTAGGGFAKYFSPTALGANDFNPTNTAQGLIFNTPYLDLTGCKAVVFNIVKNLKSVGGGSADTNETITMRVQFRDSSPGGLANPPTLGDIYTGFAITPANYSNIAMQGPSTAMTSRGVAEVYFGKAKLIINPFNATGVGTDAPYAFTADQRIGLTWDSPVPDWPIFANPAKVTYRMFAWAIG